MEGALLMEKIAGISKEGLEEALAELVRRTSCDLPEDVTARLEKYRDAEEPESRARRTLDTILENAALARQKSRPICQDTGTVAFDIRHPAGASLRAIGDAIKRAVRGATSKNYLRPNVVDTLTGAIRPDNMGAGHPAVCYEQWDEDSLDVTLVLKGGGCENVGAQYSLPVPSIGAERDINGIKKTALDCVTAALGKGCAPGVLGVGVGGDRAQGYILSKKQLHRKLDDGNPDPRLAELERWIEEKANTLGIGPMGFGGRTTLFGVKAGAMDRIPASYFVSVTYMCWAYRRRRMTVRAGEVFYDQA